MECQWQFSATPDADFVERCLSFDESEMEVLLGILEGCGEVMALLSKVRKGWRLS